MKRLNYFIGAALAIAAAVSCDKEPDVVDFPIVGDFVLYGESAEGTWAENTSVGVFVTSDGVAQSNLEYTPASTEATGSVQLNAKSEKAGFKQGKHVIYAYYPYVAEAAEMQIPLGNLAAQSTKKDIPSWVFDDGLGDMADMFASYVSTAPALSVAKKEVSEFTSAPIDLGAFAPVTTVISVAEPGFAGDNAADLDGKKVEKIVVKANKTIAYTEAKYDLATGELQGAEESQSIEVAADMVIKNLGSVTAYAFSFATCLAAEDLADAKFTLEFYVEGGKKYVAQDYTANAANMLVSVTLNPAN